MQLCWLSARKATLGVLSILGLAVSLAPAAQAQDALVSALKQRYRLTEINMQGVAAVPGTVLTIEADGINAEPYPTMITFENPVVDGQVRQRSKGLGFLKSTNLQILQPGQKVYITKINDGPDGKDDALKVTILTCDTVLATYTNGAYGGQYQAAKRYSTTLAFKVPKGSLAQLSPDDAAKMIEAVLSFNPADQGRARTNGVVTRSCEPHCAVSATTGEAIGGAPAEQPAAPPAPAEIAPPPPPADAQPATQTVALGQTIEQVTASLGQPKQIIDLGAKKIYKYADLKVIFNNGKVTDVQ